jgi:hypothetical protein
MKRATKTQLERLLARRDGPSPLEREAMLAHVLKATAPAPRPWFRLGAWSFATAAAVMLVWTAQPATTSEFAARGGPEPSVELACLRSGAPSSCAIGSELVVKVSGLSGYLTVLARGAGRVNWYFVSLPLPAPTTASVLDQAVVLSPEHGVGAFDVIFLESPEALDQSQTRALLDHPERDPRVRVVHRPLEVSP